MNSSKRSGAAAPLPPSGVTKRAKTKRNKNGSEACSAAKTAFHARGFKRRQNYRFAFAPNSRHATRKDRSPVISRGIELNNKQNTRSISMVLPSASSRVRDAVLRAERTAKTIPGRRRRKLRSLEPLLLSIRPQTNRRPTHQGNQRPSKLSLLLRSAQYTHDDKKGI